jgi:hypothetical protein
MYGEELRYDFSPGEVAKFCSFAAEDRTPVTLPSTSFKLSDFDVWKAVFPDIAEVFVVYSE